MPAKYNAVTRIVHWLTALLVITAFVLGPEDLDEMSDPSMDLGVQVHESLGLLIFGLVLFRIIWVFSTEIAIDIAMPRWMKISAKAIQGALYLLMLAVPASAASGIWLMGKSLSLLNNTMIASPLGLSERTGEFLLEAHTVGADALLWLAGIHAVAALFHHYVLKDSVLKSMLPK